MPAKAWLVNIQNLNAGSNGEPDMTIDTRPLSKTFAAEVREVDISALDDATFAEVRQAWLDHEILVLRAQNISEQDLVAFSRRFGALEIHVRTEYLSPDNPEILYVSNIIEGGRRIGILSDHEVGWHYDQIYLPRPAVGSCLMAAKLPARGGETSFADMTAAYAQLPAATKQRIDVLRANQSYAFFNAGNSVPTNKDQTNKTPDVVHPLVRTHPITGRKALYICPGMTTHIPGLSETESKDLLEELYDWSVRDEFVYTHKWQDGDAVLWDNACTMHRREPFDGDSERLMKRTTILPSPELAVPH